MPTSPRMTLPPNPLPSINSPLLTVTPKEPFVPIDDIFLDEAVRVQNLYEQFTSLCVEKTHTDQFLDPAYTVVLRDDPDAFRGDDPDAFRVMVSRSKYDWRNPLYLTFTIFSGQSSLINKKHNSRDPLGSKLYLKYVGDELHACFRPLSGLTPPQFLELIERVSAAQEKRAK